MTMFNNLSHQVANLYKGAVKQRLGMSLVHWIVLLMTGSVSSPSASPFFPLFQIHWSQQSMPVGSLQLASTRLAKLASWPALRLAHSLRLLANLMIHHSKSKHRRKVRKQMKDNRGRSFHPWAGKRAKMQVMNIWFPMHLCCPNTYWDTQNLFKTDGRGFKNEAGMSASPQFKFMKP